MMKQYTRLRTLVLSMLLVGVGSAHAADTFPLFKAVPWCGCKGSTDLYYGKVYPPAQYPDYTTMEVKTTTPPTNNELTWLSQLVIINPAQRDNFVRMNQQLVSYAHMESSLKDAAAHCSARARSNQSYDAALAKTENGYAATLGLAVNDCDEVPGMEASIASQEAYINQYCYALGERQCNDLIKKMNNDISTTNAMRENCVINFTELFRQPPALHTRG